MRRQHVLRGEVWLCDFGENIGSEQNGIRPCVILKTPARKENTAIILPASKTIRHSTITKETYHFLAHQIRTIDTSRLRRFLTRFEKNITDEILIELFEFFHKK